jgi:DNA-directed RNA polymerase subunit E'/Rpb7
MEDIYFNCLLNRKIIIEPKYLNKNIDQCIEKYLKQKIEGLCIHEGYVKPDSIKILKKSIGMLIGSRFTGDVTYDIAYTANICNPVVGNVIECNVKFINKLGILCTNGPINIIIGRQFHTNEDELNSINTGDLIKVEVIAKKFYLNDREIKIIAKLWNENDKNNSSKNYLKKELISSDVTPINIENDFFDSENIELNNDSDENEEYSMEDELEDDNDSEYEEEEETKLQLPEDENFDIADIEIDEDDDFENESNNEED